MDIGTLSQLITTFGFPVVACGFMGWYVKYITDKNREEVHELNTRHTEELNSIKDSLNNNTLVLQQLLDFLEKGGEDNE